MINEILIIAFVPLLFGAFETNSFQSTFCNIQILGIPDLIQCDQLKDTLILEEGTNITLTMNNVTDTITIDAATSQQPNQNYCGGTDKFSAYNATTNNFICTSDDTGSGGETNTASNLSPGEGLFTTKAGVDLPFKSIAAGTNISLSSNATTIEINAAGGSSGETNTASNVGSGVGIFDLKNGVDFELNSLIGGTGIKITDTIQDLTIDGNIIDSTTCTAGDFVSAVNNSTGVVTCTTPSGSAFYPDIAKISNTDTTTNINTASWTTIPLGGTTDYVDSSFTINGNGIECEYNGRAKVSASVYYGGAVVRGAGQIQIFINGVGLGEVGSSGYIRNSGGHTEASLHVETILDCVANQVIDVRGQRESGTSTTAFSMVSAGGSTLIVERLS